MSSGDAVSRTRRLFLSWGKPAVRSTFVQSSFHFSFFYVRDLFFFPELRPRCWVKRLSVTRAVITRLNLDKSESEQLVSESQRSERCLFFCLRARWKDAAMLLGADSRVCLAGGRAQSVLHFTQQQTGEKAGGEGLTVREKRSERLSRNRGKRGDRGWYKKHRGQFLMCNYDFKFRFSCGEDILSASVLSWPNGKWTDTDSRTAEIITMNMSFII